MSLERKVTVSMDEPLYPSGKPWPGGDIFGQLLVKLHVGEREAESFYVPMRFLDPVIAVLESVRDRKTENIGQESAGDKGE